MEFKESELKKAKTYLIKETPQYKNLINAVVREVRLSDIEYIAQYGLSRVSSHFNCTSYAVSFWKKYRKSITQYIDYSYSDMCESLYDFFSLFPQSTSYMTGDILKVYHGRYNKNFDHIYSIFTSYIIEEVCRIIVTKSKEIRTLLVRG